MPMNIEFTKTITTDFNVESYDPLELNREPEVQETVTTIIEEQNYLIRFKPQYLFNEACIAYIRDRDDKVAEIDEAYIDGKISDEDYMNAMKAFREAVIKSNPWLGHDEYEYGDKVRIFSEHLVRDNLFRAHFNIPALDPVTMNMIPEVREEVLKQWIFDRQYGEFPDEYTPIFNFKSGCYNYLSSINKTLEKDLSKTTCDGPLREFDREMAVRNPWIADIIGDLEIEEYWEGHKDEALPW